MASLKEIKNRIASVRSTLKITSAMKLVASAKLRKAQKAIEGMRPYEQELQGILARAIGSCRPGTETCATLGIMRGREFRGAEGRGPAEQDGFRTGPATADSVGKGAATVAIIAVASNSSLCGGFNANAVKTALATIKKLESEGKSVTVYSVGRKMAEAMKKAGYPSPVDLSHLAASASYAQAEKLSSTIIEDYNSGKYGQVVLVYNHFVSTASQKPVVEQYLPFDFTSSAVSGEVAVDQSEYILEPGADQLIQRLLPQLIRLKLFAAVLDSAAAEHAARTVAMQTASDNAQSLIADLTLEYNKGRQQKITSEILDLLGGAQ